MNIVLDDAIEEKAGGEKARLGMVVSCASPNGSVCAKFVLLGDLADFNATR